jgi:hypothetical protein
MPTNPHEPPKEEFFEKRRQVSMWLAFLSIASLLSVVLPAIGWLVPSAEWMRGFMLAWFPLVVLSAITCFVRFLDSA